MLKVNGFEMKWRENFSIAELLEEIKNNKDVLPITGYTNLVIVNNEVLSSLNKYEYIIKKDDHITILPLMGGG